MARAALVVLALVGCLAATAHGGDFRRHTVANAGLSVDLPAGWQVLAQRDAVFPGIRQIMTRLDASFALPVAELGIPDSPLKLFAFDRRFRRGHPTTILVVQATYRPPAPYSVWAPQMRRAFARRGVFAFARVDLAVGPALRATRRNARGETQVTYVVPGRTGLWALMLRTPSGRARRDGRLLFRAASSLELGTPVGGPIVGRRLPGS
jgi:hypothetical protein